MITLIFLILFPNVLWTRNCTTSDDPISQYNYRSFNNETLFCGIFAQSGCYCREYVNMYATCYAPDDCKRFPKTFKTTLTRFELAKSGIENITVGDLDNLTNIETLEFELNSNLKWMESGTFKNMSQLRSLTISYNDNLFYLEEDLFKGLVNLENLTIRQNGFAYVKNFSLSLKSQFMPKLRRLKLEDLRCLFVDREDFIDLNGSTVEELDILTSQIEYIHPEALIPLKNLHTLNLNENNINITTLMNLLKQLIQAKIPLSELSLHGWGFKKDVLKDIIEVISKSNLKKLILSKNQFDVISGNTFPLMPHLQTLDLTEVLLSNLSQNTFYSLPNLKSLKLSNNKLSSVPRGALLRTLEELDLSKNSYFSLDKYKFENLSNLEKLNLSLNDLRKISNETFVGLVNLRYLHMQDCNIFFIEEGSFASLKKLKFLNLQKNHFPSRAFTKGIFEGLENLEELELGFCGMNITPTNIDVFKHLRFLKRLDLRGNNLKVTMVQDVFLSLVNLEVLNIGENSISVWHNRLFQKNEKLRMLHVYDNKLTHFTAAMLEDIMLLRELDISKNPYNCECKSFINFSYFNATIVEQLLYLINYVPSNCVYPDEYSNYLIIEYFKSIYLGKCQWQILPGYSVPAVILLILLIITMVTIVVYLYRWHIRYWMFLTKIFLSRRAQFKKNVNLQCHVNYLYDAFVSYSNEDRNFVVRLVAMLENYEPFLRLCVYERDFEIGTIISESVLECVSRSRKTLLVVSNSYIKSQWCRWEAQVAENHRLFFENEHGECVNDSIIIIKLGNVSRTNLSPMLKYLMKTRIYLQWDSDENKQRQFWEKLRNALAAPASSNY